MMFNYFGIYPFLPKIPEMNMKPPTLYAILNSIVNFGKEDKTKIRNLANQGRTKIFDFDYPLSNYVNKEEFETNILNHFIKRRIGFQTITDFQIHLETKLNEIMPFYNKMFDVLENWTITESEKLIHDETSNRTIDSENSNNKIDSKTLNETTTNQTTTSLSNQSTTETENTNDRRQSELPQSQISNVQNASYLTDYTLENNTSNSEDNSTSNGTNNSNGTNRTTENYNSNENGTNNTNDDNIIHSETTKINPSLMFEYLEKMQKIYTLIYKDLDCLFYQLI